MKYFLCVGSFFRDSPCDLSPTIRTCSRTGRRPRPAGVFSLFKQWDRAVEITPSLMGWHDDSGERKETLAGTCRSGCPLSLDRISLNRTVLRPDQRKRTSCLSIPDLSVSRTSQYPGRLSIPDLSVSRTSQYPGRLSIPDLSVFQTSQEGFSTREPPDPRSDHQCRYLMHSLSAVSCDP